MLLSMTPSPRPKLRHPLVQRVLTTVVAVSAIIAAPGIATAHAAPSPDLAFPGEVLEAVGATDVALEVPGSPSEISIVDTGSVVEGEFPATVAEVPAIGVAVAEELTTIGVDGEFSVAEASDGTSATYLRDTVIGGQAIFASNDVDGLDDFRITFDTPIARVVPTSDGHFVHFIEDTSILVQNPWAFAGDGSNLPTTLRFEGQTLIQDVRVDAGTTYPVVADPAWTYVASYGNIQHAPATVRSITTHANNFTNVFPVPGAPANFPSVNQFLPLEVGFDGAGFQNFNCFMNGSAYEAWPGGSEWGFSFRSAPGHIDGPGSNIAFRFVHETGELTSLYVFAQITNANPADMPQWLYEVGARAMWLKFATNVAHAWP